MMRWSSASLARYSSSMSKVSLVDPSGCVVVLIFILLVVFIKQGFLLLRYHRLHLLFRWWFQASLVALYLMLQPPFHRPENPPDA